MSLCEWMAELFDKETNVAKRRMWRAIISHILKNKEETLECFGCFILFWFCKKCQPTKTYEGCQTSFMVWQSDIFSSCRLINILFTTFAFLARIIYYSLSNFFLKTSNGKYFKWIPILQPNIHHILEVNCRRFQNHDSLPSNFQHHIGFSKMKQMFALKNTAVCQTSTLCSSAQSSSFLSIECRLIFRNIFLMIVLP